MGDNIPLPHPFAGDVRAGGHPFDPQAQGNLVTLRLAVLKVNATGLTAAEFGNSEQTQVGERVCVIGNPGGRCGR